MTATVPNVEKLSSVLVVDDITFDRPTRVYMTDPQGLRISVLGEKRSILESFSYSTAILGATMVRQQQGFPRSVDIARDAIDRR
jgi:hypothetical protein